MYHKAYGDYNVCATVKEESINDPELHANFAEISSLLGEKEYQEKRYKKALEFFDKVKIIR